MATSAIVQRAKSILYGHGIGEKPVLLECAADAAETISNDTITIALKDAAEGDKVTGGDVLSMWNAAASTNAHVLYVLSEAAGTVTCINGFLGSPAVADTNLDSAILEILPGGGVSEHVIYQNVETVFLSLLYPDIWEYATYSITPQLDDFQVELNAAVERIEDAWQIIGSTRHEVAFSMAKNVHTSVSSTTVIAELVAFDSSSVFITTVNRITESSTLDEAMTQMIATGAAALAAGGTVHEATLEASGKDSQIRLERSASRAIWQDFGTLRTALSVTLEKEVDWFEYERG